MAIISRVRRQIRGGTKVRLGKDYFRHTSERAAAVALWPLDRTATGQALKGTTARCSTVRFIYRFPPGEKAYLPDWRLSTITKVDDVECAPGIALRPGQLPGSGYG